MDRAASTISRELKRNSRRTESLMVFLGTPVARVRDAAHSAVEMRFVRQIYAPN